MSSPQSPQLLTAHRPLLEIAQRIQISLGLTPHGSIKFLEAPNRERAKDVAVLYEEFAHDPRKAAVARSYQALCAEIQGQFDALLVEGYSFSPWTKGGQPYPNSAAMRADVLGNKHLAFFLGGEFPADHPLAADSDTTIGGYRLRFNDQLRVIHDIFGHALYGAEFGPKGELLAARVHLEMFQITARAALFTETAAQACWFYFGPAAVIPAAERPFAEQKAIVLPARFRGMLLTEPSEAHSAHGC